VVVALAVALIALALAVASLLRGPHVEAPVQPRPTVVPTPKQHVAPIPRGAALRLVGTVRRMDATTWSGPASGVGRSGTLTLTGPTRFAGAPTQPRAAKPRTLRWRWVTQRGTVGGCVPNTILRRPHRRWVWDGLGRITTATGDFRRYSGQGAGIAGETRTASPEVTRIILGGGEAPQPC
jgi:hypothetical protein